MLNAKKVTNLKKTYTTGGHSSVVERLVANEKVEGSTPFARSIKVIRSNFLTSVFQNYLGNRDIRIFKGSIFYYFIFRLVRNFLSNEIIVNIYNFKVFGSNKKNKTSYYLLKKCEFGDHHELDLISKFSKQNKIIFLDCGCNYGFYSLYASSSNAMNRVISIEASKNTSDEFIKNLKLNNFSNIHFYNNAISNIDDKNVIFYESENDWESSQNHSNFKLSLKTKIKSVKIDTLITKYNYSDYIIIIKLDIEGNEVNAILGALDIIKKSNPLIIIEFSKYTFENLDNIDYFKNFLLEYDYSIYDTNKNKKNLNDILLMIKKLKKKHKTIGNFYLIKNLSNNLETFFSNE